MKTPLVLWTLALLAPLAAAETPPPAAGAVEGRNIDGMPPINSLDPITGKPVDPRLGTYCIVMAVTDAKGPVTDVEPSRRLVCIGFSSAASLDAFAAADRLDRERLAREALRSRVEKQLHLEPSQPAEK